MNTIIEFMTQTPWWVYVIFIYLIILGTKALQPRVISLKRMFILPLFFTVWSIYSLYSLFNSPLDIVYWFFSIILGTAIGWIITAAMEIKADKKKYLILLPGTYSTLILVVLIFGVKYFFGFIYSSDPLARKNVYIYTADLITSGFITGMFVGKSLCFWSKFKEAHHKDLRPSV
jgi:hypothetical protein